MSAASIPVAVLGGGAYAARLVEVLAASPDLPALDVRLHARDRERLAAIAGHAAARLRALGSAHAARACLELDDALDGAAAVVLLVRVGGLAARAHDEGFPGRFGHVGDEGVGLGGIANAWRTVPVLAAIAERIAERAPGAHVLNMMAPLGVTTRLLAERGLRAVGLCELPTVTAARWRSEAIRDPDAPLALAGLNHLAFFWSESAGPLDHPVLRVAIERGEVPAELAYRLAAVPLHYYIDVFQAEAARRLGRRRQSGRAAALTALRDDLVRDFRAAPGAAVADLARRPTPWFDLAVVPALAAVLDGPPYHGPLDSTGGGVLAEAPAPVVVELLGVLDAGGVRFDPVPARPPAVAEAIGHLAGAEDLVYRASVARDRGLLLDALAALPLAIDPAAHPAMADAICFPVGEEAAR